MSLRRKKRVCFASEISNYGRYQEWLKCLVDNFRDYAVRYNDFALIFAGPNASVMTRAWYKLRRIMSKTRAIPPILTSEVVVFSNMGINYPLFKIATALGKQTVVDVYISNYQTIVLSRKLIREDTRRARRLLRRERYVFSHATKAVFLNESEREFYCDVVGCVPRDSYIIPLYNKLKREARLPYFNGLSGRPRFCWWGGEGNPIHGLSSIVRALKLLEEHGVAFDFEIFGWDEIAGRDYYAEVLDEVGWEGRVVPRYDLSMADGSLEEYLADYCDVAFGPMANEPKALNVITNKALDAINMRIPLVMVDAPAMRRYFGDDAVTYCAELDPISVCRVLEGVLSDGQAVSKAGKAKVSLLTNFGTDTLNRKFLDMLNEEVG